VIIRFGKSIHVPTDLSEDAFEQQRLMIEHCLEELYEETDRIWEDPEKISEIFTHRSIMQNFT
jgi:hypothetical protein